MPERETDVALTKVSTWLAGNVSSTEGTAGLARPRAADPHDHRGGFGLKIANRRSQRMVTMEDANSRQYPKTRDVGKGGETPGGDRGKSDPSAKGQREDDGPVTETPWRPVRGDRSPPIGPGIKRRRADNDRS